MTTDSNVWLESFSVRAYHPMIRLAEGKDQAFLSGRHSRDRVKRYRRTQRKLLREYLRGLTRDFQRLHSIAAQTGRSDGIPRTITDLHDNQLSFIFTMFRIEAWLAVEAVFPRAIDLQPLLESVENLARAAREINRPRLRLWTA
jgi:hypothetical protein